MSDYSPTATPLVEAFFDFNCPWSFVAFNRANEAAMRTMSRIEWRPLQCSELTHRLPELSKPSAIERASAARNWMAWLDYCGLSVNREFDTRADSRNALLATLYATECGKEKAFIAAVFDAHWTQSSDISELSILLDVAEACELNLQELQAWLAKPVVADALQRNLEAYLAKQGFATPGFSIGDRLFIGNEQMPLVELALGQDSDISFVMPGSHNWDEPED
jgi:2-hydroxychromene-2-carboxylate isomerase